MQPDSPLRKEIGIFRALRRIEQNRSKQGGKDQESIQSSTPPDPIPHGKVTKTQLNITNKSQEVSPFPAGDHKAAMNRRESMKNTRLSTSTSIGLLV